MKILHTVTVIFEQEVPEHDIIEHGEDLCKEFYKEYVGDQFDDLLIQKDFIKRTFAGINTRIEVETDT